MDKEIKDALKFSGLLGHPFIVLVCRNNGWDVCAECGSFERALQEVWESKDYYCRKVFEQIKPRQFREKVISYPELIGYKCRGLKHAPPKIPPKCPVCNAKKIGGKFSDRYAKIKYACGGGYHPKPQIQNHTDYWWGTCGLYEKVDY